SLTLRPLDPNLKAPYDINMSIGVEQQLPKGIVGSVTYMRSRGLHLFRTRNINAPTSFSLEPDPDPSKPARLIPNYPNLTGGFVYELESSGISETNRIVFGFNRRAGRVSTF